MISKIILDDGSVIYDEKVIRSEIHKSYKEIYEDKDNEVVDSDTYLEGLPQISERKVMQLDNEIMLDELTKALKSCCKTDMSPGPDGIPYKLYKKFWNQLGPELIKCWQYSIEIGKLSPDQRYSVITLIPKPGKDTSKINNL